MFNYQTYISGCKQKCTPLGYKKGRRVYKKYSTVATWSTTTMDIGLVYLLALLV